MNYSIVSRFLGLGLAALGFSHSLVKSFVKKLIKKNVPVTTSTTPAQPTDQPTNRPGISPCLPSSKEHKHRSFPTFNNSRTNTIQAK
jgi:hypothetical protein